MSVSPAATAINISKFEDPATDLQERIAELVCFSHVFPPLLEVKILPPSPHAASFVPSAEDAIDIHERSAPPIVCSAQVAPLSIEV